MPSPAVLEIQARRGEWLTVGDPLPETEAHRQAEALLAVDATRRLRVSLLASPTPASYYPPAHG